MGRVYLAVDGSDVLSHHGVLGMKWGVRRYQPYPAGEGKRGRYVNENGVKRKVTRGEHKYDKFAAKSGKRISRAFAKADKAAASGNEKRFAKKTQKALNTLNKEQAKAEYQSNKYRNSGNQRAASDFQKAAEGSQKTQKAMVSKLTSGKVGSYRVSSKQTRRVASKGKAYLDANRYGSTIGSVMTSPYLRANSGIRLGTKYKVKVAK